jgi:hypothetical protein
MSGFELEDDDDYEYDEVKGTKKHKLAALNKKKLPPREMDELFLE